MRRRLSCRDDPNHLFAFLIQRVRHYQQILPMHLANRPPSILPIDDSIMRRQMHRIKKC